MRRGARILVPLLVVAAGLTACGSPDEHRHEVQAAFARTVGESHRFVYTEEAEGRTVEVRGLFEDHLRYKAGVSFDGQPVFEQVVYDDEVVARFLDTTQLGTYIDREAIGEADMSTELEGVTVLDALRSRRWVSDPTGAPPTVITAEEREDVGENPILDARATLAYAQGLFNATGGVVRYNPDSISPTYRPSEDPFPAPEDGSGITRYDLRQPSLPSLEQAISGTGGTPSLPNPEHFRKAAVYVQDGRIVRIMEVVELSGRRLQETLDLAEGILESSASSEVVESFKTGRDELGDEALGEFMLAGLNQLRELAGEDPIRPRKMTLTLGDLGDDITVERPVGDDVITAELAVLRGIGRSPTGGTDDDEDVDDSDGEGGSSGGGDTVNPGSGDDGRDSGGGDTVNPGSGDDGRDSGGGDTGA